jgi:uncharacterized protein
VTPARLPRFIAALAALLWAAAALAEVAVPPLKARVTDLTGTLTAAQRANLEETLRAFENLKGAQIAVLIVPTTRPEAIEQYSMRVAEQWRLGRKGVDDGALLLVAKDDRKLRIEVGYGLEGVIPDAVAKRVIAEVITPYFRQGDFYGGIEAGVNRLTRLIEGEPLPPPVASSEPEWQGLANLLPFLLIAAIVGSTIFRLLFGRLVGASVTGGIVGLVTWLMLGAFAIALIAAVVGFVIALVAGTHGGRGGPGRWSSGGSGWGGGGGGGGFSGGGGGFGGGGASGSW